MIIVKQLRELSKMANNENLGGNTFADRPQDINRNGRPKKEYCLTDILKEQGNIKDVESKEGMISRKEAIGKKLWAMAMGGDVTALKYLYDRVDGKPLQTIEAQVIKRQTDLSNLSKEDKKELARLSRKSKQ